MADCMRGRVQGHSGATTAWQELEPINEGLRGRRGSAAFPVPVVLERSRLRSQLASAERLIRANKKGTARWLR